MIACVSTGTEFIPRQSGRLLFLLIVGRIFDRRFHLMNQYLSSIDDRWEVSVLEAPNQQRVYCNPLTVYHQA